MKRMVCLALVLLMAVSGWALAEENAPRIEKKNYVMAGFDDTPLRSWEKTALFEVLNDQSLKALNGLHAENTDEATDTTIHFDFQVYNDQKEWKAYKASLKKDGDMPDVLFKAGLTTTECQQMMDAGVLIDLKEWIDPNHTLDPDGGAAAEEGKESCCPNLLALLQQYPEAAKAITLPDGRIAALPYIQPNGTQNYVWINEQWLENLGLEMPTDRESFENVLRAFRDKDPNRNGKKDEIPLSVLGPFDLKFLAHAYGMICNDYNIFAEDGQVKYMPLQENFRPFLEWCRMLWQEGLMDKDSFSTTSDWREKNASNDDEHALYGVILAPLVHDVVKNDLAGEYAIMMPLNCEGVQMYRNFSGPAVRGTFAVTSACDDPEAVLRWVDQMYTPKAYELIYFGVENKDFYYNAMGQWEVSADTRANQYFANTRLMSGGATAPGAANGDFERKAPDQNTVRIMNDQDAFAAYAVMPFPYYSLTPEQSAYIAPLQNKLGAYVDTMMGRFIIGDVKLNDINYQQFTDTLAEMGTEEFLAFWQTVLEAH